MNIDFSNIANLTPIGFARFLLDSTEPDGTLRIPKNFGTDDEQYNEFDTFKMSWGQENSISLFQNSMRFMPICRKSLKCTTNWTTMMKNMFAVC